MNIVDHAKDLRASIVDRIHPQRVVFHHVPKCGGTSVGRALRKRYLMSQATIMPDSSYRAYAALDESASEEERLSGTFRLREQMLLYWLYEDTRCVSAHVHFSPVAHQLFAEKYKFITILRDPVKRLLSNFHWSHDRTGDHGRIGGSFRTFLDSQRAEQHGAMYVQYFAGLPSGTDLGCDFAIAAAIRNLERFDVVGLLDDLPMFVREVEAKVGVRLKIGHENKQKRKSTSVPPTIDPELMARIEQLCAPDIAIWNHMRTVVLGNVADADG